MTASNFDIVIPTAGRPCLTRLLEALAVSTGPRPRHVFVVDDRADRSASLPLPPLPPPWGEIVAVLGGKAEGPAAARNIGWRASSAEWVGFVDDDVVPPPDWLDRLAADLEAAAPGVGGSQGIIEVPLPADRHPTDWERNVGGLETAMWVTADMAYRREALEAVGGFDERFPRAYREDADVALRVQKAGFDLVKGSRTVLHPPGETGFWTSVRRQSGNRDDAAMRRIHGPRWRETAMAGPGRLASHLAATAAFCFALSGPRRFRIAALAVWTFLTGRFAWQRIEPGPRTRQESLKMTVTSALIPPAAVFHRLWGEVFSRTPGWTSRSPRRAPGPRPAEGRDEAAA